MYIERNFSGTREDFFNVLVTALVEDVKNCTDKDISQKDIKEGFSYRKVITNKKNHVAKATIKRYQKPELYRMKISSDSGTTLLEYRITKASDYEIKVNYREEYTNQKGKVSNGCFYKRGVSKRVNRYFGYIQKYMNDNTY